jgi:hypothetical protein
VASLAALVSPEADPDFWWHVRTGQYILAHGLQSHDLYTFTVPGHVWTDHEWLTEVLMAWVYGWGGMPAISIGFGLLTWAGLLLLARSARAGSGPYVVVGLGLALAVAAGGPIWGPRAQMITFFLTCLEMYWIRSYLAGRSRALYWFPLLTVLWANLHGGWVIGLGLLVIVLLAETVRAIADRDNMAARVHARRLAIIAAISVVAVAATPYGLRIYAYPIETVFSTAQQQLIVEWFSPDFHRNDLKPFEAMLMLLFVGFILRRPSLVDLLLSLAAVALALQSVRNVALFVAVTTPILIETWSAAWRELADHRRWRLGNIQPRPLLAATTGLALAVVTLATVAQVATRLKTQDAVTRQEYPVAAADWLAQHPDIGTHMFNQYGWGGYLAYRFYPDPNRRVYIFGEAALMGDPLLNRYQDVAALRPKWMQVLDEDHVDYVVFNNNVALTDVLATEPGWTRVYEDGQAVIYVRSGT